MNPAQIQKMMKQAQQMQGEMQQAQKEFEIQEFNHTVGGGAIEITMLGSKQIINLKLNPEIVDKDDIEMLQDMIKNATNALITKIDQQLEEKMGAFTKGLPF